MLPSAINGLYEKALIENRNRARALAPFRSAQVRAIKTVTKIPLLIEESKKRCVELARSLSERDHSRSCCTTVVALPKGCMDIFVSTLGENLNAEHFM
jgi:hypothetical protein